jgi:hypothetical protein
MLTSTTHCALSDKFFQTLKAFVKNTRAEEDACASNFPISFRIYFFLKDIYIYICFYICTERAVHKEWIQTHIANSVVIQADQNISDWINKIFSSENYIFFNPPASILYFPKKKVFHKLEWFIVRSKVQDYLPECSVIKFI